MGKEFVIKNGLIINGTHSVSGITNDSGLTYNQERLVTEDAIKKYIDVSSENFYTTEQADDKFVYVTGDTMTGDLVVEGGVEINNVLLIERTNPSSRIFRAERIDGANSYLYNMTAIGGAQFLIRDGSEGSIRVCKMGSSSNALDGIEGTYFWNSVDKGLSIRASDNLIILNNETKVESNITSTSPTTGALIVDGGVGIGENLNIGGYLGLNSGTNINDISTDSGFTSSSDDQIATTSAIKDYISNFNFNTNNGEILFNQNGNIIGVPDFKYNNDGLLLYNKINAIKYYDDTITEDSYSYRFYGGFYKISTSLGSNSYDYINFSAEGQLYTQDTTPSFDILNLTGNVVGLQSIVSTDQLDGDYNVSNVISGRFYIPSAKSGLGVNGSTIQNSYAIKIVAENDSVDTLNNAYGLYIEEPTDGNSLNYSIYSNGLNYLERLSLKSGTTIYNISTDSGLTGDDDSLWTTKSIQEYVLANAGGTQIYSDPTQVIFNSGGTLTGTSTLTYENDTLSLERFKFERIEDQPIETGTTFLNSSVTWTYNNSSETFEQTELDFLYYSNGRWFEKQTGYEVFVQTKDATLGHNDLEEIGEYCKRQFTRMQPARFFSPWILEDGTQLYGTGNIDKVGFNINGIEGGDEQPYNLVSWEGIFSPYTTSNSFMSHPALLRFSGTNILHNKHPLKCFSFYNTGELQIWGYGKDWFEFYEVFNIGGNLKFQVGNFKIGSLNNGTVYIGNGTGRTKLTIGSLSNFPTIYIDGKDSEFNCARLSGRVYIGWNGTTTYDNCVLFADGAGGSSDEVWYYGDNCRSYISGCQKMYVVSGSTGSLIEGSNNTIEVRTGAENTLIVGSNCTITIQSGALKTTIIGSNNTITNNGTNTVNLGEITNLQNTNIKGILNVENTTTSTSTTTGAVTVEGGVGIGENIFIGGNIKTNNNISLKEGTSVNNISTDSGLTGDDDSLWTTKAIQEYVSQNSSQVYSDPTQIIFNSGGTLTGSSNLTYDGDILITNGLKISGDTLNITENRTIINSTDTGEKGEICWDENYIYVCIDTNTWKRTSIADW
jgi:hypothetical protein